MMITIICALVLAVFCPKDANALEYYSYDAATNTYTLNIKDGQNITEALEETLEVMAASSSRPGTVIIPEGSYEMYIIRILKSHVTISAEGATIKYMGATSHGSYMVKATDARTTGVTISGGVWDGNKKADIVLNFGSGSVKHSDLTFKNCVVKNGIEQNIRISNGTGVTCQNVTVSNSNYGVYVSDTQELNMENCSSFSNTFGYGLRSLNGEENYLKNCAATGNRTDGLQIKDVGTVARIESGKYNENTKNGISMTAGATAIMKNADVSKNKSNGISPVGSPKTTTKLSAYGCTYNDNGRHGVAGDSYVNIYLKGCQADNNASNGIMLNKGCKSSGLINNITNGNGASGILVQGNSTCTKIENCVSANNKKLGISVADVSVSLVGCSADYNNKHGIYVAHLSGYNGTKTVTITNCTANSNKADGICITEKKTVTIKSTTVKNNGQSGIGSKAAALKVIGNNNVISGNKKYGISGMKGNLYISNAKIINNGSFGVYFMGNTTNGYCINSTITGNRSGIGINQGANVSKINNNRIQSSLEYGIFCNRSTSGRKTTLKECKGNILYNPKAKWEVICNNEGTKPSALRNLHTITIGKSVKKGATKISGIFTAKEPLKIMVNQKTYKVKASKKGTYSKKVARLKTSAMVKVIYIDKYKNKIMVSKKI